MESQVTQAQITKFWLKVYFDLSESYLKGAIKRAYRDFNRTIEYLPKGEGQRVLIRENWISILKQQISHLLNTNFSQQEEFDTWHEFTCHLLRGANENCTLSQGQAQKWVNMSLKYLFAMGEQNIPGISNNYRFFHIPIDRNIMDILDAKGIAKHEKAWSKIPDYDWYYKYQVAIRELYNGRIPMDVEFELFNEVYNNPPKI